MNEYAAYLLPEGVGGVPKHWPVRVLQPDGVTRESRLSDLEALAGQKVTLVLPMELFSYCQTGSLPGRKPAYDTLAFAVEDQFATALETLHLAFGMANQASSRPCLVIDRACFEQLLSCLRVQGVQPQAVLVDADMLASTGPTALWLEGRWLFGGGEQQRLAVNCAAARVLSTSLPEIKWLAEPGQASRWDEVELVTDAFALLWQGRFDAINLLQGAFAPGRAKSVPWQALLGGCLLAALLACIAEYWHVEWLQGQVAQLKQHNVRAFQRWAPGHVPRDDLARQINELMQHPAPPTAMQRLAVLSESLVESGDLRIERAEVVAGQGWRIEILAQGFDDLERFRQRLPGLQVERAQQAAQQVSATLTWPGGQ
ncbi:type II secretion system protein GspL [Pseudomonas sp. A014]|uniref:type II secretion system protein GspL n=1 Tax=Pseudomonas sp. A014 TaxID=3458058 RepID=UPI0040352841